MAKYGAVSGPPFGSKHAQHAMAGQRRCPTFSRYRRHVSGRTRLTLSLRADAQVAYGFFLTQPSIESFPGPNAKTIRAASKKRNGAAPVNLSPSLVMASNASRSAVT